MEFQFLVLQESQIDQFTMLSPTFFIVEEMFRQRKGLKQAPPSFHSNPWALPYLRGKPILNRNLWMIICYMW